MNNLTPQQTAFLAFIKALAAHAAKQAPQG